MVSRNPQQAHRGRLPRAELRQGELPPQALDADDVALVLDRLPKLLVDSSHLGRGCRFVVSDARKAEQIARKFRVPRMEYEGSAHSERTTEKASFEDDIVSREA
jgi:hypothetical protein